MKNKLLIGIATLLLFLPWTILPLRTLPWALASPAAEIMISCYAAFMIFGGIFSVSVQGAIRSVKAVLRSHCVIFTLRTSSTHRSNALQGHRTALSRLCDPDRRDFRSFQGGRLRRTGRTPIEDNTENPENLKVLGVWPPVH